MNSNNTFFFILFVILIINNVFVEAQDKKKWENGMPDDPDYFPIAVWLQNPSDASKYKEAGINLYIGLWKGPNESQLETLRRANMPVMCPQNETGLQHLEDSIIVGWTQQDEPDNAQSDGAGGYDPCVDPEDIYALYKTMKKNDPTRPVYLNLGQGVSNINYKGRGECTSDTLSYYDYIEGCDIASFDIYPVTSKYSYIKDNLWYVPKGIDHLKRWSYDEKPVWCWIECTRISSESKPDTNQVKAEVWMAIIHGAKGFGYFCHEFAPAFNENALLDDKNMLQAVTNINTLIHQLAPVINSPNVKNLVSVTSENENIPVDYMVKQIGNETYIFAVSMRDGKTQATFLSDNYQGDIVEVVGEDRSIAIDKNIFSDEFSDYQVHIYRIKNISTGYHLDSKSNIRVFPNPSNAKISIESSYPIYKIGLLDMKGLQIIPESQLVQNSLDVHAVPSGMYILEIKTDRGTFFKSVILN